MQVKFDHVALRAKDPEEMKDFLIKLLVFEVGFRPDFPFKGYWLYANGKDVVHIFNEKATFYKGKHGNSKLRTLQPKNTPTPPTQQFPSLSHIRKLINI